MRSKTLLIASGVLAALCVYGFVGQGDGFKRERNTQTGAAKDALEGKEPPALEFSEWLNTSNPKGFSWKDLKGKVVVIDFWAHW